VGLLLAENRAFWIEYRVLLADYRVLWIWKIGLCLAGCWAHWVIIGLFWQMIGPDLE